jgi:hypothetical protein
MGPRAIDAGHRGCNTIQNSRNINLNGQFNFVNLYNKIEVTQEDQRQGKGGNRGNRARRKNPLTNPRQADSTKTASRRGPA